MTHYPAPNFAHLFTLTGPYGTYEHAKYDQPRVEHGYCVDDVARVLVVALRETAMSTQLSALVEQSLDFLVQSQTPLGIFRNRRSAEGIFCDEAYCDDSWGRAMWALGACIASASSSEQRATALALFSRGTLVTSHHHRSLAFAILGASEVLSVYPTNVGALSLMLRVPSPTSEEAGVGWLWREPRLTYANAVLPEAMMIAGQVLGDEALVLTGLEQLAWLLNRSTAEGYLSVTPTAGAGPEYDGDRFDQQPIEVAAMADACSRAHDLTGHPAWLDGVTAAADWFMGANDGRVVLYDPSTGGGFDGLTPWVPNLNQGAESTLSFLSTMQRARQYALATS